MKPSALVFSVLMLTGVMSEIFDDEDMCSRENLTDFSYYAKNRTSQNCGCTSCIRRCCKPGFVYKQRYCYRNESEALWLPVYINDSLVKTVHNIENFIIGYPNCSSVFRLNATEKQKFYVQVDGSVYVPQFGKTYGNDRYCVDGSENFTPFLCFTPKIKPESTREKITGVGMIISMPFLLMTFLAYLILPESNIHRKSLMCYVLTLLIGYIFLVAIQLNENYIVTGWCHFLGYSIVYFFLASFFWMNVMCIDMWLAFSGIRGFKGKKSTELKRFLAYFLYAMGMPFSLLLIIFLLNTYADESSIFHPHLGQSRCFLEDGYPNLFYFYLPMAIIIGINIVLFILTAVRIQRVKKETSMLKHSDSKRHSYEEDKQKFNLYLKLLFAMGINWSMEVISWAVEWKVTVMPTWIWYLTDFANAAYGVFIFFIFVFKKKIWITLKKRYYVLIGKPHLAHTLSTSQPGRTSTTNYSTTDTALNETRLSELKNGRPEERPLNRH